MKIKICFFHNQFVIYLHCQQNLLKNSPERNRIFQFNRKIPCRFQNLNISAQFHNLMQTSVHSANTAFPRLLPENLKCGRRKSAIPTMLESCSKFSCHSPSCVRSLDQTFFIFYQFSQPSNANSQQQYWVQYNPIALLPIQNIQTLKLLPLSLKQVKFSKYLILNIPCL